MTNDDRAAALEAIAHSREGGQAMTAPNGDATSIERRQGRVILTREKDRIVVEIHCWTKKGEASTREEVMFLELGLDRAAELLEGLRTLLDPSECWLPSGSECSGANPDPIYFSPAVENAAVILSRPR
jgi:hypothetical protein